MLSARSRLHIVVEELLSQPVSRVVSILFKTTLAWALIVSAPAAISAEARSAPKAAVMAIWKEIQELSFEINLQFGQGGDAS